MNMNNMQCWCFDLRRVVEEGAIPVSAPEKKEWGQKVGYVRDIGGIVVRMGSHVSRSSI